MAKPMRGAGGVLGGGGTGSAPTTSPDDLISRDWMEVLIGLCEGPIAGLKDDSLQNLYIGDTPFLSTTNVPNFTQVDPNAADPAALDAARVTTFAVNFFPGDPEGTAPTVPLQIALHDYGSASSTNVNVNMSQNVPIIRQTTSGEIDFIDIRIVFSNLYHQDDTGVFDGDFSFTWEVKALSAADWVFMRGTGGAFDPQDTGDTVLNTTGKTTQRFVKQYRAPVTRIDEPYMIRVTRLSVDDDPHNVAIVEFESYQEVVATPKSYPNTALTHMLGQPTNQFSSVPNIWGIYKGLNNIRVPSNYDPATRIYSGDWDGTWQLAWTDNPAFILQDFLLNDRYGVSAYTPINLDKFEIYAAAQWCDQAVPSSVVGQTQPRYTMNMLIAEPRNVQEMLRYLAGAFNAVIYDDFNGTIHVKVDKPETAVCLFAPENVVDGMFNYSYTDISSRVNDITVGFTNPDQRWITDHRVLTTDKFPAIAAAQEANGRIPLEFIAVGCINADEALRRGYYKFLTANTEVEMVTFRTNRLSLFVEGFEVILVSDPTMGFALSGRTKTISNDRLTITLRDPLFLETGVTYSLNIMGTSGVDSYTLTGATAGFNTQLHLTTPLSDAIKDLATFAVVQTGGGIGAPKPYRVMKIEEVDGNPDLVELTCMEVNRNKWIDADTLADLAAPIYSFKPAFQVAPVTNLTAQQVDGNGVITVVLGWTATVSQFIQKYRITYRRNTSDTFQLLTETSQLTARIENAFEGFYEFSVIAINANDISSPEARTHIVVTPVQYTGDLPTVTGLELAGQANDTEFVGKEPHFDWRLNFPVGYDHFDGIHGANTLLADKFFKSFDVKIYDPTDGHLVRTEAVKEQSFIYTYDKNRGDGGGPRREFRIEVAYDNTLNAESPPAKLEVSNPAPAAPTGLSTISGLASIFVSWDQPTDADYAGTLIWSGTTNPPPMDDQHQVYDGTSIPAGFQADPSVDHFLIVAHYDAFGKIRLNPSPVITANAAFAPPTAQPDVPTGLALSASLGTITATWDAAASTSGVVQYEVSFTLDETLFQTFVTSDPHYTITVQPARSYFAKVRAINTFGVRSAYSSEVSIVSVRDTTPPDAPTNFTVTAGFQTLWLKWTAPTATDLSYIEVSEGADLTQAHASVIGTSQGTSFVRAALGDSVSKFYWIRAFDTSGNASPYVGPKTATTSTLALADFPATFAPILIQIGVPVGTPTGSSIYSFDPTGAGTLYKWNGTAWVPAFDLSQVTGQITTTQITAGSITTPLLAAGAITTAKLAAGSVTADQIAANSISAGAIQAGAITASSLAATNVVTTSAQIADAIINDAHITTLSAAKLVAGSALAGSITVSGTPLGTIAENAADPASGINAGTTLITPGKIQISGPNSLSSWLWGTDNTKIDGGVIGANSISARSLMISNRQVQFPDMNVQGTKSNNHVTWSAGTVQYMDDTGAIASVSVAAGTAAWSSGILYLYWGVGNDHLSTTTSSAIAYASNNVVVATYNNVAGLVCNYGATIIDGANIVAGTITGASIAANSITGDKILANSVTAGVLNGGTITAASDILVGNANVVISAANKWIKINDGSRDRVWLGTNPDGGFGIKIVDAVGNTILSSAGVPHTAVTGLGPLATGTTIPASSVTGLGTLATMNVVTASSISGQLASGQISGLGAFATLNQITGGNIGAFMASAAITSAFIGDGEIFNAKIHDLAVDTIKITHGAISSNSVGFGDTAVAVVALNDAGVLLVNYSANVSGLDTGGNPIGGPCVATWGEAVGAGTYTISSAIFQAGFNGMQLNISVNGSPVVSRIFRWPHVDSFDPVTDCIIAAQGIMR